MDHALGVALIGTGFMGKCHAMAWRNVATVFGGAHPRLEILCDTPEDRARDFAAQFGFARASADWQAAVRDPAVDVVSITTPNGLHRPMAEAALRAGKHVWLEKPMALTLADAQSMADLAAAYPGQVTILGYNYLRSPAFQATREMIASGQIGRPLSFRGVYDEDYSADPDLPWTWRMTHEGGGLGALGDLGCHLVSQMVALMGPVAEVTAMTQIAVAQRPSPGGPRTVENEDSALALIRFASGAQGSVEGNWIATGRKMQHDFEVYGTKGALAFSQEHFNVLHYFSTSDAKGRQGFRRIEASPDHPPYGLFCVAAGHQIGFNDLKAIEVAGYVQAVAGKGPEPFNFRKGLRIQTLVETIQTSSREGRWLAVG